MELEKVIFNKANCDKTWCERCEEDGVYFSDLDQVDKFIVCEKCGYELAYVYCDICESEGQFIDVIEEHPRQWKCPECQSSHYLPDDFYDRPIILHMSDDTHKITSDFLEFKKWIRLKQIGKRRYLWIYGAIRNGVLFGLCFMLGDFIRGTITFGVACIYLIFGSVFGLVWNRSTWVRLNQKFLNNKQKL